MWKMNKLMCCITIISFVILCNIYQIKSQTIHSVLGIGSRQPGDQFLFIAHNHTQLTTTDDYLTFVNTGINTTLVEYVIRPVSFHFKISIIINFYIYKTKVYGVYLKRVNLNGVKLYINDIRTLNKYTQ